MLPKKKKILIQNLPKKGFVSHRSSFFTLKIFPNQTHSARFGVIISKKVAKLAVHRNQLKRLIFNTLVPLTKQLSAADYLIIVNKPIDLSNVCLEIKKLFERIK